MGTSYVPNEEQEAAEVAKLRKKANLRQLQGKKRKCLRCEKEFDSPHAGVRSCDDCRNFSKFLSNNYWDTWGDV
jgi:hypothetical protein